MFSYPRPGRDNERAWQAKHYPDSIRWDKCKISLADAIKNYEPDAYTFCFPRDLSGTEQKTFDKHFRNAQISIPVDFWNGSEIQARLTETDAGKTVAGHFFDNDGETLQEIKRAALAKGELSTVGDALERMNPIGEFLGKSDPYYSYPAAIYEADGGSETPIARGSVMSFQQSSDGVVARVDVVPRDQEALDLFAPKGTFTFPRETYERVEEAMARGEAVTAEEVEVTFDRLPPAFSEDVGKPMTGSVTIKPEQPRPPKPWDARFVGKLDDQRETLDVRLEPTEPPEGWDGCLEGSYAGMTARLLFRRSGAGGQMQLTYNYQLTDRLARDQLRVLRFLNIVSNQRSTVEIIDKKDRERTFSVEGGAPDDTADTSALLIFFEGIVEIESWTAISLPFKPEDFTEENFQMVTTIASAIRRKGFDARFEQVELALPEEKLGVVETGKELVIEQGFGGEIFGQELDLGRTRVEISGYLVERRGEDSNGNLLVGLVPTSEEGAKVFQHLAPPTKKKKPPAPPRKRKSRSRSRRKSGRSR
jgi:hypothetical protein